MRGLAVSQHLTVGVDCGDTLIPAMRPLPVSSTQAFEPVGFPLAHRPVNTDTCTSHF